MRYTERSNGGRVSGDGYRFIEGEAVRRGVGAIGTPGHWDSTAGLHESSSHRGNHDRDGQQCVENAAELRHRADHDLVDQVVIDVPRRMTELPVELSQDGKSVAKLDASMPFTTACSASLRQGERGSHPSSRRNTLHG